MSTSRILLRNVRLAFPTLNEAQPFRPGEGNPRFSATGLFSKENTEMVAQVEKAMLAAAEAKWPNKGAQAVKALRAGGRTALVDGDLKGDYDGFEGSWSVAAHAQENRPPRLLDGLKNDLPRDTPVIYGGCYVNLLVEFWAQDNQWGKRINASLLGVQFVKDGDAFSGAAPASDDEFETVEGAHDASEEDLGDFDEFA